MPKRNPKHSKWQQKIKPNKKVSVPLTKNNFNIKYPAWLTEFDCNNATTETIFSHLSHLNIHCHNVEQFLDLVEKTDRQAEIINSWWLQIVDSNIPDAIFDFYSEPYDLKDLVKELWHRLSPDKLSQEDIMDLIWECDDGNLNPSEGDLEQWLRVWNWMITQDTEGISRIADFENKFEETYVIRNWVSGYITYLFITKNFSELLDCCSQLLNRFPDSDSFTIYNWTKNKGLALLEEGYECEGEELLIDAVATYTDDWWIFTHLGDYFSSHFKISEPPDIPKALKYYEQALERIEKTHDVNYLEDKETVQDRIDSTKRRLPSN